MGKYPFVLLLIFAGINNLSAQNLVLNPDFEDNRVCPYRLDSVEFARNWSKPSNHVGTSDYFHKCATHYNAFVPKNFAGYEEPASGNAYAGLFTFNQFPDPYLYREYIMGRLSQTLEKGVTYNVSFKYSLSDESGYSTKNFGVLLTDTFYDLPNIHRTGNIQQTPQIRVDKYLDRTNGWETMCFSYTASGNEKFLILGNFDHDSVTEIKPNDLGPRFSYVYIDDVEVYKSIEDFSLGNDTTLCAGDILNLQPLPGVKKATYVWQDKSTDSIYTVRSEGKYWVDVLLGNCRLNDTILVNYVKLPEPLEDTTMCSSGSVVLNVYAEGAKYTWQDNSTSPEYTASETGIYWVRIELGGCTRTDTIEILAKGCSTVLEMPNIFTPNEDPFNNLFRPIDHDMVREFEIHIFNRWGEKVYESKDISSGWDGTDNGNEYPEGVYFWVIDFKDTDGARRQISGTVTLLR